MASGLRGSTPGAGIKPDRPEPGVLPRKPQPQPSETKHHDRVDLLAGDAQPLDRCVDADLPRGAGDLVAEHQDVAHAEGAQVVDAGLIGEGHGDPAYVLQLKRSETAATVD